MIDINPYVKSCIKKDEYFIISLIDDSIHLLNNECTKELLLEYIDHNLINSKE